MSTPPNEPIPLDDRPEPGSPEPVESATGAPEPLPRRERLGAPTSEEAAGPVVPAGPAAPAAAAAQPPGSGVHAAPRPYPPSPGGQGDPAPTEATSWSPALGAQRPTSAQPPAGVTPPPTRTETPDARDADAVREESVRDLPEPPTRPGMGRHLLAALLGLVLTPFALTMIGIGIGRLSEIAGTTDMGTDLLGGTLLSLGVLMLVVIVLLGTWSAALPVVGGLVWGVGLGAAYLIAPSAMRDGAEAITADGNVPVEVEQLADAGMNGSLLVLGALLVAAGLAVSLARRRGRRFAEQVALADRARADAEREGAGRRAR